MTPTMISGSSAVPEFAVSSVASTTAKSGRRSIATIAAPHPDGDRRGQTESGQARGHDHTGRGEEQRRERRAAEEAPERQHVGQALEHDHQRERPQRPRSGLREQTGKGARPENRAARCRRAHPVRTGRRSCLPRLPPPRLAEQMHSHPRFTKCQVPRPGAAAIRNRRGMCADRRIGVSTLFRPSPTASVLSAKPSGGETSSALPGRRGSCATWPSRSWALVCSILFIFYSRNTGHSFGVY